MRVLPITCYRPTPEAAPTFAALPYDVFSSAEAFVYVTEHPQSFLAIDRAETAFEPGHDPYAPEVYEKAGELIRSKLYEGVLLKDQTPCFYLYRLEQDGHSQTGIVCACSVAEYEQGIIRRHEKTRPDKTSDRVCHITATGAQTGPVFVAYRDSLAVDVIAGAARASSPLYDFTDDQGVHQTIWRIARESAVEALQLAFTSVPCAYIADGHHRASAAAEVSHNLRAEAGNPAEELLSDSFLAVLFPASQLSIMAYNRVVADTCDRTADELIGAIEAAGFEAHLTEGPVCPQNPRTFGLYLEGRWHELRYVGPEPEEAAGPAAALDVAILQERVLGPILGIDDPRTSKRITFVGGIEGTAGLERRAGKTGVAFSLCPPTMDDLMCVSDAGELMPPKSTWFEPKLRSGLFIRRI